MSNKFLPPELKRKVRKRKALAKRRTLKYRSARFGIIQKSMNDSLGNVDLTLNIEMGGRP